MRCDASPAPNLMFNSSGLLKTLQSVTVFTFPIHICNLFNQKKSEEKLSKTLRLTFVCFKKMAWYISRVVGEAAGGASKTFLGAGAA
jgi:hypothetical protein